MTGQRLKETSKHIHTGTNEQVRSNTGDTDETNETQAQCLLIKRLWSALNIRINQLRLSVPNKQNHNSNG